MNNGRSLSRVLSLLCFVTILTVLSAARTMAGNVELIVSSSGIPAWLVREPSSPVLALSFVIDGGGARDPQGKPGVASMVARLLTEGAGTLDAHAFHVRMQASSTDLFLVAGLDRISGSLRTLAERRSEAAELLRLALTSPRFDPGDVERIRKEMHALVQFHSDDAASIAVRKFRGAAFRGHAYEHPVEGSTESIAAISVDDLKGYVRDVFARNAVTVAIVGNIEREDAASLVDRIFDGLPATAHRDKVQIVGSMSTGKLTRTHVEVSQSVAVVGGASVFRHEPDFIAALLANEILAGDMPSARLFNRVREQLGLVYYVRGHLASMTHAAYFLISAASRPDRIERTVEAIRAEFRRLADDGPTEDELTEARAVLKGAFAASFDSSTQAADKLAALSFEGATIDYVNHYDEIIDGVRRDDVGRLCRRLFGVPPLVAVAGPAAPSSDVGPQSHK